MNEVTQMETVKSNANAPVSATKYVPQSPGEAAVMSAVESLRSGLFTEGQMDLMMTLGEAPRDFQELMESLLKDLEPRPGIERHLVDQIGQSFWRLRRAQRMQDGMAARQLSFRLDLERARAVQKASATFERVAPFQQLEKALGRRVVGPTAEEIDSFIKSRIDKSSDAMVEFIHLLKSLRKPMEEKERKAVLRKARVRLRGLMESYENAAWRVGRQMEKVDSPENLAALMAPNDPSALLAQKLEDSSLRRIWRLTNAFQKVRTGALHKKRNVENDDQSRNVYENKQNEDKMPPESSDI